MVRRLSVNPDPRRWLACRRRRPDAAFRLICFPHSGGSSGEYVRWGDFTPDMEVWAVQLPGRGARLDEPNLTRMDALVDALLAEVTFAPPFALFGHSKGALVAYEVARGLRDRGRVGPSLLVASAYRPPPRGRRLQRVSQLSDEDLLAAVEQTYGTLPAEIRAEPELVALMVPPLRADFEVLETYTHVAGEPLDCPILVAAGADDEVKPAELDEWRLATRAAFELATFPGGHFYLRDQRDALLQRIADALRRHAGAR